MTRDDLLKIGFTELPHFTVMGSLIYDLGRNRQLSIGSVGTPNEMMFICDVENKPNIDVVVLHNYDYDGYLTIEKVENLIKLIKG